ncbi:type IV pilin protein [Photobacterium rosenbergii]|uniref:type IV pilin protein n=1 Tax=Photobacterium rosenbergii TaxID=294936 RepID=UPI001C9959BF|nr:type IV pilin protein [Photobacterium rosenbergii]MBY5949102.1 prepilin-type N-terminal cleavage/methylation domain-containing protein [Photobacterium rosenbergii]
MKRHKGVTLIELLIVTAVIGILGAIAYPSYQTHTLKAYRSQAMTDLIKIQLTLEEQFTKDSYYSFSLVTGGTCSFCESKPDRYKLSIDSSGTGEDRYIIAAIPQSTSGQDQDSCKTLSLNAAGIGKALDNGTTISGCW